MRARLSPALGFLLLAVAAGGGFLRAQGAAADPHGDPRNVDAVRFGEQIALGPNWLFSAEDNPANASPALNDSGWKTVSANGELTDYGFRDIPYGWYRLHIHLRPGTRNLVVGLKDVSGAYEVYANGVRIGGNGDIAGMVRFIQGGFAAYDVPDGVLTPQGDLILALRFAVSRVGVRGRGTSTPIDSDSGVYLLSREAAPRYASAMAAHRTAVYLVLASLSLLAGLVALALYLALRSQREYLAVTVYLLASSAASAIQAWNALQAETIASTTIRYLCVGVANVALIEFMRMVLGMPRARWLLGLEIAVFAAAFGSPMAAAGVGSIYFGFIAYFLPVLIVDILLLVLLVRGWIGGNREARVLLPAMLLYSFEQYWNFLRYVAYFTHLTARMHDLPTLHLASYDISLYPLCNFFFYITMLLFLVLRTVSIARERARAAAELEAARTVQQVLIPEQVPATPGFTIQSVYKPAGQVGGDFFQIMPVKRGGVLVVIGDVSGKGMPAAMTVSLLVGTVRTLAHYTESPGEILAAMNQRMLSRSHGGFTTCLVLRARQDGTLVIANAGHIAPYLAGKELPLDNGLPLGLSADTAYAESTFHLAAGQQLTLLTDGVVEARDRTGALFGFERTSALSIQPAEAIASAAQAFGQDDDITALTLARIA
jgi:hypothetical protein